jgi:hypothetical protein
MSIEQGAWETRLTERKIQMILGTRQPPSIRTPRSQRRETHKTISEGRYDQLANHGNLISASVHQRRALLAALERTATLLHE